MNDPLEKLTQNAFPIREAPPPSARMWSRIEADLPKHASRNRLWLPAVAAMATLLMAIGIIQFGSQPHESKQKNDAVIHSLLASNRQTEHWLQAERPLVYQQNQEAIAALHMAIDDLMGHSNQQSDDPRLNQRLIRYAQWQNDLLTRLVRSSSGSI